jgi:hypothetical protein
MPPGSCRPGRERSKVAAGAPCRARAPARKGRDGESRRIVPRAVGSAPSYQQSMSVGIVQYHTDTTAALARITITSRLGITHGDGAVIDPKEQPVSHPLAGSSAVLRISPCRHGAAARGGAPDRLDRASREPRHAPPPQGHSGILKPTVGGRTRGHTRTAGAAGRVEGQLKAQGAEYLGVRYYNSPEILQFKNAVSRESHDVVDCLLRLGTELVIRIDIRGADDAPSVDDEASRHRQGPAALAVAHGKIIQGAHYLLQSIQLCDAVGSPATAENGQDQRALSAGRPTSLPRQRRF